MNTFKRMVICLLSFWLVAGSLMASPADDGRKAFESGDYKKAYKLLSKAAKGTKDKLEKADLYVMAGASAAKMGKKKKAKSRFGKALKLNPDVSLPAEVAGDAKVKKSFASAQKKFNKSSLASSGGSGRSGDSLKSTKSASGKADRSPNNLTNYLPFGINSFLQGKTITGAVYGGGQVAGILIFLNRRQAASDADKDAEQVIAQAQADGETENPEFLQFIDDNEAFVTKSRSEANLALGIFAASYVLSVVDALFDPFGTSVAAIDSDKTYAKLGGQDAGWKFDLNVLPTQKPMVFLDMKQNF